MGNEKCDCSAAENEHAVQIITLNFCVNVQEISNNHFVPSFHTVISCCFKDESSTGQQCRAHYEWLNYSLTIILLCCRLITAFVSIAAFILNHENILAKLISFFKFGGFLVNSEQYLWYRLFVYVPSSLTVNSCCLSSINNHFLAFT